MAVGRPLERNVNTPSMIMALGRGVSTVCRDFGGRLALAASRTAFAVWIPAFAGMTGEKAGMAGRKGEDSGVGLASPGAPASRRRSRACARRTLILAFSHEGRRDPLLVICAWFRVAGLVATVWIPAFAGMTGRRKRE